MIRWLTKKRLFEFHGWLGLTLGLPLFVICLSGTFAVISPELDWLVQPAMRVTPPEADGARPLAWGELIGRIRQAYPAATVTSLHADARPGWAWQASVSYSPDDYRLVFIDPYTGRVQGQSTAFNARSFFRIFHKQLYILRGDYWPHGRAFVCVFSIVLLLSAATALLFFKGWWRALWQLRLRHGARLFWSDLHRAAGVWSLLLGILFGITGLWYFADHLMEEFGLASHEVLARIPPEELAKRPPLFDPAPLDELIARALREYPEFEMTGLYTGPQASRGLTLIGSGPAVLADEFSNQIHIDPWTRKITRALWAHELPLGPRLVALADPLHFGRFGGVISKTIWTLAGLALSAGILAGAVIWWLRKARRSPAFFHKNRFWTIASLVFNLGLVILAAFSTAAFIGNQVNGPRLSQPAYGLGTAPLGPWEIAAFRHGTPAEGSRLFSFRFNSGKHANYKAAYAWMGGPEMPSGLKPLSGTVHKLFWTPPQPVGQSAAHQNLRLAIEAWNGSQYSACFPLESVAAAPAEEMTAPEPPRVPTGTKAIAGGFLLLISLPILLWLACVR